MIEIEPPHLRPRRELSSSSLAGAIKGGEGRFVTPPRLWPSAESRTRDPAKAYHFSGGIRKRTLRAAWNVRST
jgi:hypothetical protein